MLTEKSITTTQILVLGIGTTLGIVAQALVLIPYMKRSGFHWRWRFRASSVETVPMSEVRTLAGWVLGYVAFSQIGVYVINRVAIQYKGGVSTFTYGRPAVPDAVRDHRRLFADRVDATDEPVGRAERLGRRGRRPVPGLPAVRGRTRADHRIP